MNTEVLSKVFAISVFGLAAVGVVPKLAFAAPGMVTQIAGVLTVQRPDGSTRVLSQKSEIQSGDTLNTQRDSFAQIKFEDGAQITIKPGSSLRIENFNYQLAEPQNDNFFYRLVKGGMRAVTGAVGKRGNADAYKVETATATIGIRGTTFGADDCTSEGANCRGLESGVYVSVSDGEIVTTNNAGTTTFLAGQFGLIDSPERRPRFLSTDPGLQFTPPASFIQSISGGSSVNSGKSLECVVRAR